jgi:hypothetical protein
VIQPEAPRKFVERALGLLPQSRNSNAMIVSGSKGLRSSGALGTRQEVRHVPVVGSVARPPLRGRVPAIIVNRHIDAAVNEKLRCFVVSVDGALMQDEQARRTSRPSQRYPGSIA